MRQTRRKRTLLNNEEDVGNDIDSKAGQHSQTTVLEVDPLELPEETAQGVWESLKEEFHASIEQLPLSFHRTFSLISEQDREAQVYYAELLPTIRSYIRLRQSLQESSKGATSLDGDSLDQKPDTDSTSQPLSDNRLTSVHTSEPDRRSSMDSTMHRQYPDNDSNFSPRRISRMRDATVPKSVPFPPRQKPRSTKELLIRISYLLSEIMRALEEKVGLANSAHDSIIRHIKVLEAAIAEHDGPRFSLSVEADTLQEGTRKESNTLRTETDDGGEDQQPNNEPLPRRSRSRAKDRGRPQENQGGIAASSSDRPLPQTSIDVNEKRYCYCNQVSYGEMVACDGPMCKYEWYHLGCVGLSTLPSRRGKWYCPDCQLTIEQNKKRKGH